MKPPTKPFRHTAGFGKRIEYWVVGRMLKEGMDVYLPLVDDQAVDAIVRRQDGSVALIMQTTAINFGLAVAFTKSNARTDWIARGVVITNSITSRKWIT